ncbi:hypothetical protein GLOIN_2v1790829 [Rhizophagus irregularis DAOM 181602=DAOM 197198]|nr:hypothetical protein GLOIN_2v1790829 [Rhizophagus irregularis DAOM 181602=DAOM 197198]
MDDSTLIASSKIGIDDRLSITAKFYTLNNIQANSAKYVLLSSSSPSSQINFDLSPSSLVTTTSLYLSSLTLNTSFQFLGVWFSLSASPQFVLKQSRSMVKDMAALLGPKKLLTQHIAYLYNAVLLPRLEFRLQTTFFSESTIHSIIAPIFSVLWKKAGLAATTPLALSFLKLPFSIQNAFYQFLSSHIASWQKIFTHPDFKDFALYAISYLQGYLGAESCPTVINLEPWTQVVSLQTHTLFNSLLFSSRLNITWFLPFRPPRQDLQPALSLQSILPHLIFQTAWKLWKQLNIFVLAQLASPCGRYLMNCYATSLALVHLTNPSLPTSSVLSPSLTDKIEDDVLPLSVQCLYTDGSYHIAKDSLPSFMTSAWLALDDDGFILESSSLQLPSCFPSASVNFFMETLC